MTSCKSNGGNVTGKISGMLVSPTPFERVWEDEKRRLFSGSELCPDSKEFIVSGEKTSQKRRNFRDFYPISSRGGR